MIEIDREKLAEDNMNLVYYVIRKYYPTFIANEEVVQSGMYGLAKACKTFDPDKGIKFSTYAVKGIRTYVLDAIDKEIKRTNQEISLDAELNNAFNIQSILVGEDDVMDVSLLDAETFVGTLNEREKIIVNLQKDGYTQREIAEILGVTYQRIGQIHRRIKLKWREFNER